MLMTPRVWVGRVKDGVHPLLSERLVMDRDTSPNDPNHELFLPPHILAVLRGENKSDKRSCQTLVQSLLLKLGVLQSFSLWFLQPCWSR